MTWDIKQDTTTGDWIFSGHRDLMHAEGESHIYQRIMLRLKIPRGEYLYDDLGNLGSLLHETTRRSLDQVLPEVPTLIREALAPMPDIHVADVSIEPDPASDTSVRASIAYNNISFDDEAAVDVGETPGDVFIASIQI